MKTKFYAISLLLSLGSVLVHADEVLPAGLIALTGTDVQVTSVDNMNRAKTEKPVVKTQNNKVFFTATTITSGEEIWVTDGTVLGTKMVKDINTGTLSANPKWLTAVGNTVYFVATTAANGEELWMTDGTDAGTKMVKDIYTGITGSAPFGLTAFNSSVLFFAMDDESEFTPVIDPSKPEKWLWISDGTLAGTKRIANTPTKETNYDGQDGNLVKCGNKVFFVGYDLTNNESLWTTDGTTTGTKVVKNINPRTATGTFATASGAIDWLVNVNDKKVAFRAETVSEVTGGVDVGSEIWLSDGTAAGTNWIGIDFAKGQVNGLPRGTQFAVTMAYGDTLFFRADDGVHGVEPCVLDISKPIVENVNPRQFFDINHWGKNPSYHSWPSQFAKYKGDVYIQANGGYFLPNSATPTQEFGSNYSLWRAPLSTLDTCIYQKQIWDMEIFPGNFADGCTWFKEANGRLFFAALNVANNKELWVIDNPSTAPKLVVDFPANGLPCQLTNVSENLIFASAGTKVLYKYATALTALNNTKANNFNLKVYPNPSADVINITSNTEISKITIVDLAGKQLKSQQSNSKISVSNLAKGTYILKVNFTDGAVDYAKFSVK